MSLKPFDKAEIITRFESNFQASYLTLISIIQGVAFGVLVTNVADSFITHHTSLWLLVYPGLSLCGVIIVFYCYSWFVSVVFAKPSIRESVIPFLLGTCQVVPMLFFRAPSYWWLGVGCFSVMGALAFFNTVVNLGSREYDADCRSVRELLSDQMLRSIALCLLAGLVSVVAFAFYPAHAVSGGIYDLVGGSLMLCVMGALVLNIRRSLAAVYQVLDMTSPDSAVRKAFKSLGDSWRRFVDQWPFGGRRSEGA